MARIDDLPADQKATLQLLLTQGKSYEELAGLLRLAPDAVRERALTALDALGPDTPAGLTAARQDEISDFLLSQQGASQRASTRDYLERSAGGRAWARAVAAELRAFNGADVPDVPAEGAEVDEAFGALEERREARAGEERSSRLGGILLLAAIGIAVAAVLVILLKPGGGDDDNGSSQADTGAQTTSTASTGANGASVTPIGQANLTAKDGSKSAAVAFVLRQDGHNVLGIQGQDFASFTKKGFFYAVWLTGNGKQPARLGFVTTEIPASGENKGQLLTGANPAAITGTSGPDKAVKSSLTKQLDGIFGYGTIEITRETAQDPKSPGTVVASGAIQRASTTGSSGTSTTP